MCLVTNWEEPKIAEKDIICYKIYEGSQNGYVSPYRGSPIPEFNKITYADYFQEKIVNNQCHQGFHSFVFFNSAKELKGRHLYFNIFKCIIPKGARYYEGFFGIRKSYCSDRIIVIG